MKNSMYGQLDLTKLGQIAKLQPGLVKEVQFKDGVHKLLNISLLESEQPDKFGNTATIRVDCKKDNQITSVSYFVANMKPSQFNNEQPTQNFPAPSSVDYDEELGF